MQKIGGLNGYYWKWCIVGKSILSMSKEINIGNEATRLFQGFWWPWSLEYRAPKMSCECSIWRTAIINCLPR
jgi:hypothetical protein